MITRRRFLLKTAVSAAGAAVASSSVALFSERAEAFLNAGAFWKKPNTGNDQTSNGYTIGQSLRFNGSNTYLMRTPAGAGNRKTWTFSIWAKRSKITAEQQIFSAYSDINNRMDFRFGPTGGDEIYFQNSVGGSNNILLNTTAQHRDPSAWYHIVVAIDTTLANSTDRACLYINGSRVSAFAGSTYPSQNADTWVNAALQHEIGAYHGHATAFFFSGYYTEIYLIDGQALDASAFGQVDTNTGQWIPKAYSGAYGTNGFYLKFDDNSAVTAATLGKDSSGNANNWTPTGFQTHDQVLDSPTNNFPVSNTLMESSFLYSPGGGAGAFNDGSLTAISSTSPNSSVTIRPTIAMLSGKYYFEGVVQQNVQYNETYFGVSCPEVTNAILTDNGNLYYNGGVAQTIVLPLDTSGFDFAVAYDASTGAISFYVNGALKSTYTAAAFVGKTTYFCAGGGSYNSVAAKLTVNFGQGGQSGLTYDSASGGRFKYTPPAGFKALSTANLSAPIIKKPNQYFNTILWQGNDTTNRSMTGLGFQPDLLWSKCRNTDGTNNVWTDSVRGASAVLYSDNTNAESTPNLYSALTSDGFTTGTSTGMNNSARTYVAWSWKKGATPGFDIVTYTGTGATPQSVSHSLGGTPAMIIVKSRTGTGSPHWVVYHKNANASPHTGALYLELTNGFTTDATAWNNTAPTSSVFSVGPGVASNSNYSGSNYIAYLWAEVPGFSKFGSYTGNGSSDGPFVYCGFKPRWIMIKRTDSAGYDWWIQDTSRDAGNPSNLGLAADTSNQEYTNASALDYLSNGFKPRATNAHWNASGGTYIFAAFAEAPFKYATAR